MLRQGGGAGGPAAETAGVSYTPVLQTFRRFLGSGGYGLCESRTAAVQVAIGCGYRACCRRWILAALAWSICCWASCVCRACGLAVAAVLPAPQAPRLINRARVQIRGKRIMGPRRVTTTQLRGRLRLVCKRHHAQCVAIRPVRCAAGLPPDVSTPRLRLYPARRLGLGQSGPSLPAAPCRRGRYSARWPGSPAGACPG